LITSTAEICTVPQLAALFRVTPKTVHTWVKDGLPVIKQGRQGAGNRTLIGLRAAVDWYFENEDGDLDLSRERAMLAQSQRKRIDLDMRVRERELMPVSEALDHFGAILTDCRARLIQIPDAVGQFCDPKYAPVVVAEVRKRVYEALDELSRDPLRKGNGHD
jgi:phage terminase Nu1 subunit (DNA packaging protein)